MQATLPTEVSFLYIDHSTHCSADGSRTQHRYQHAAADVNRNYNCTSVSESACIRPELCVGSLERYRGPGCEGGCQGAAAWRGSSTGGTAHRKAGTQELPPGGVVAPVLLRAHRRHIQSKIKFRMRRKSIVPMRGLMRPERSHGSFGGSG